MKVGQNFGWMMEQNKRKCVWDLDGIYKGERKRCEWRLVTVGNVSVGSFEKR
jgi:hypothetical protein